MDEPLAAAADYDRVIARLDPPEPEHYLQRARWLIAEGDPHVDAALRGIDEAIARLGPLVTLVAFAIDVESRPRSARRGVGARREPTLGARRASQLVGAARRYLARGGALSRGVGGLRRRACLDRRLSAKRRTVKATAALEARLRRLLARDGMGD